MPRSGRRSAARAGGAAISTQSVAAAMSQERRSTVMVGRSSPHADRVSRLRLAAVPAARLDIEYDGTRFAGWACQPGLRTVQGELERALAVVLGREVALTV